MSEIIRNYNEKCRDPSDIHEHMPTLYKYALECNHITECGVRSIVSSYAFACGLKNKPNNKLIQVDPYKDSRADKFKTDCQNENINVTFYEQSDLECPLENTELLFIDTWHVYGQLKRELQRWNSYVSKYIILHDTTVDEWYGETIRLRWDAYEQSKIYGIPVLEINMGLWPAVVEFLSSHPDWRLKERFTNCNGLTILERV